MQAPLGGSLTGCSCWVKSKRVKAEAVILVGHDQDGNSIVMDQAGPHTITAANPLPDGQGQALEAITSVS